MKSKKKRGLTPHAVESLREKWSDRAAEISPAPGGAESAGPPGVAACLRAVAASLVDLAVAVESEGGDRWRSNAKDQPPALAEPDPSEPSRLSFASAKPLRGSSIDRRERAHAAARDAGYDLEWWSGRVRVMEEAAGRSAVADAIGVSVSAIEHWSAGLSFARGPNRSRLEAVGKISHGWSGHDWKNGVPAPTEDKEKS